MINHDILKYNTVIGWIWLCEKNDRSRYYKQTMRSVVLWVVIKKPGLNRINRKFFLQKNVTNRFWFCVTFDWSYNCSLKLWSVYFTGLLFKLAFNPLPCGVEHVQFLLWDWINGIKYIISTFIFFLRKLY